MQKVEYPAKSINYSSGLKRKMLSAIMLFILVASISSTAVPVSASVYATATESSTPTVTNEGDYTKIVTDTFTVIVLRNGTKPTFVWWANNDTSEAYVVQYKGLIEYAQINGSSFKMANIAEGELFEQLIDRINAWDLNRLGVAEKGLAHAFLIGSELLSLKAQLLNNRANMTEVIEVLESTITDYQNLRNMSNDTAVIAAIDEAIGATETVLALAQGGATQKEVANALGDAVMEGRDLMAIGIDKTKSLIGQIAEQRQLLKDLANNFHRALLNFASCRWEMSEVSNINAGNSTIGIAFTMTLVDAPDKFDFADGNVKLVIRIYSSPVDETFTLGGQSYSYSIGAGEVKMDFVVEDWDWNFEPRTVEKLNSTYLTVNPALALWIDASKFGMNYSDPEPLFLDMDNSNASSTVSSAAFNYGNSKFSIRVADEDQEANQLQYTAQTQTSTIAGKAFRWASSAKLKLYDEGTLGGFFKFVPYAIVTNDTGEGKLVNVSASYISAGNHVRIYVCYPYFNGTMVHDPSIGIESDASQGSAVAQYIVSLGAGATGVTGVQAVPISPTWGNAGSLAIAGGAVALGALAIILVVRRNPALT